MIYSAALLALWLWLDLCGSSGAGCLLAVLSPPPLLCWLWLFWRSASGFDLWAALPLGLCLRVSSSASVSGAGASSAPVLSGRVQAFPCPVLRLFWGWRWETMQAKRIWQNAQFCKAVFVRYAISILHKKIAFSACYFYTLSRYYLAISYCKFRFCVV